MSPASGLDRQTQFEEALARANAALAADSIDVAIEALGHAAALSGAPAPLLHDRGYLELASDRIADAASSFHAATVADPGFALAYLRLGVARQALDQTQYALEAFERAAALEPARADAPYRTGALLATLGRMEEAERAFSAAAATAPPSALSRLACARLARDADDHALAETVLRALLTAHPGHLEATELLGATLAEAGQLAEARDRFSEVVMRSHHYAGSFYDMSLCQRITSADAPLIARLEALSARPGMHHETLTRLHLGLGKAADDLGEPLDAMRHFAAASALRDPPMMAAVTQLIAHAERMRKLFDAPLPSTEAVDDCADAPILILGLPRSGTTLIEHILSSHAQVHAGGELAFWSARAPLVPSELPTEAVLRDLARSYRATLDAFGGGCMRVTDKAPLNVLHAGLIHLALPDARFVLCRRRPIDVALSIHRTWFNRLAGFPTGGEALVDLIRAVDALSDHWRAVLPAPRFYELRYERLVASPETEIRALLAFCGLSFDPKCLTPERNPRAVRTPSKWQVRRKITAPNPEAWRRFAGALGPLAVLAPP